MLDFPTLDRFIEEIRDHQYDVVGISSITPNRAEGQEDVRAGPAVPAGRRRSSSAATSPTFPTLNERIDADRVVRGEGVRWFRRFLGEDPNQPIRHPVIPSRHRHPQHGNPGQDKPGDVAATLIPSVGCPVGCNFCSTSAMFGGKGKFVDFYETGDELFDVMCQLEARCRSSRSS